MTAESIQLRDAHLSIEDGVARFTHQRPERRNPFSLDLRADYVDLLDRIEGDAAIRALVITGSGGAFSAGGDLQNLKSRVDNPNAPENSPDATRRRLLSLHGWVGRLRNLEIPVIAAVDGPAVGAGMSLALLADFVLASSRAVFGMSFVKVGLVPDMAAAYLLPRIVGLAMAKDLVLTGRKLGVEEAKALGIVHSIYPHEQLEEAATAFARKFIGGPPQALGPAKRMLNASFDMDYGTFVEVETNAQAVATTTPYHAEALRRFFTGEAPAFDWDRKGR